MRDLPRYSWSLLARFPDDDVAEEEVGDASAPSCEVEKRKDLINGRDDVFALWDVLGRVLIAGRDEGTSGTAN